MKREHIAAGYDPTLDRRQQEPMRLVGIVIALAIFFVMAALIFVGVQALSARGESSEPLPTLMALPTETSIFEVVMLITSTSTETLTPSPTRTVTPDSWGRTGTAMARTTATETPTHSHTYTPSQTPEYCAWLTPSPTPSPTLLYTPDSWGATGTAIYLATNPAHTPTPELPRELCTDLPRATASFTPFPIPELNLTVSPEITLPAFLMGTASAAAPIPTRTTAAAREPQIIEVFITAPPVEIIRTSPPEIIEVQVEVPIEIPVEIPVEVPVEVTVFVTSPPIIITATYTPTLTPTNTATATTTSTPTATATATWTFTSTFTPTFTATSTETPTLEPTVEVIQ